MRGHRGVIVYEVAVEVDAAIEGAYRAWLRDHVDAMLSLPGFTGADVFDVVDPPPAPQRAHLCVQYRLLDDAALQAYLRDHAPRMRADGVARFGNRVRATRRVLSAAG